MFSKVKIELQKARPRKALICKDFQGLCSRQNVRDLFPLVTDIFDLKQIRLVNMIPAILIILTIHINISNG